MAKLIISEVEPPIGLFSAILTRVVQARQRSARLQLVAFGTVSLVCVLLLVPALQYAASEFYTSGFYDYASLLMDGVANGYWRDVVYSLSNSLPSSALLLLALIGTASVWSLRQVRHSASVVFTGLSLAA